MRTRYPIDRSFGIFSRVSPPFGRGIFALARAALVRGDQIRPAQLLPAEDGGMKLAE